MKILHIPASLNPERGGPTKVVLELTEILAKKGVDISIFVPGETEDIYGSTTNMVHIKKFKMNAISKLWTSYSPSLAKALERAVPHFDIVHIHELWHHPHFLAYQSARVAKIPYCITIHGGLEPWCLSHKSFKKKVYSALVQKKILQKAAGLHAITDNEAKEIYKYVDNKNIFQIPNGLNSKEFGALPKKEESDRSYPELKGKKVILFLGRIHPVKGLNILSNAFVELLKKRSDIHLVIAGPNPEDYKRIIIQMLRAGNAMNHYTFTGMVTGREKLAILARADIFVLPSYSEVLGLSALEAMACGLPVVITKQCHFPEVEEKGAGKVINPESDELSKTLEELLGNETLCEKMGEKGKTLVREEYTWDQVADKMIIEYRKILERHKMTQENL